MSEKSPQVNRTDDEQQALRYATLGNGESMTAEQIDEARYNALQDEQAAEYEAATERNERQKYEKLEEQTLESAETRRMYAMAQEISRARSSVSPESPAYQSVVSKEDKLNELLANYEEATRKSYEVSQRNSERDFADSKRNRDKEAALAAGVKAEELLEQQRAIMDFIIEVSADTNEAAAAADSKGQSPEDTRNIIGELSDSEVAELESQINDRAESGDSKPHNFIEALRDQKQYEGEFSSVSDPEINAAREAFRNKDFAAAEAIRKDLENITRKAYEEGKITHQEHIDATVALAQEITGASEEKIRGLMNAAEAAPAPSAAPAESNPAEAAPEAPKVETLDDQLDQYEAQAVKPTAEQEAAFNAARQEAEDTAETEPKRSRIGRMLSRFSLNSYGIKRPGIMSYWTQDKAYTDYRAATRAKRNEVAAEQAGLRADDDSESDKSSDRASRKDAKKEVKDKKSQERVNRRLDKQEKQHAKRKVKAEAWARKELEDRAAKDAKKGAEKATYEANWRSAPAETSNSDTKTTN